MATIENRIQAKKTRDGAGVPLNRVFGYYDTPIFDPFLMLDYFYTENTEEVAMGFPWHPHRGIETVTYMKSGYVEHEDSLGNKGLIGPGDVQWMTAGSGIIHQEMPQTSTKGMEGFQFWLNLASEDKMTTPNYGDLTQEMMPTVDLGDAKVKVIAGTVGKVSGPIQRERLDVSLMDVQMQAKGVLFHPVTPGHNVFLFVYHGAIRVGEEMVRPLTAVQITVEEKLHVIAEEDSQFILGMGKRLDEPIAWRGPIVMNTMEEIHKAFDELDEGTFIKK